MDLEKKQIAIKHFFNLLPSWVPEPAINNVRMMLEMEGSTLHTVFNCAMEAGYCIGLADGSGLLDNGK